VEFATQTARAAAVTAIAVAGRTTITEAGKVIAVEIITSIIAATAAAGKCARGKCGASEDEGNWKRK
jgi:uncharacterized low-complexity protein